MHFNLLSKKISKTLFSNEILVIDQMIIFPYQLASPVAIGGCVVGGVYPDHGTLEEIYQVCYIARI